MLGLRTLRSNLIRVNSDPLFDTNFKESRPKTVDGPYFHEESLSSTLREINVLSNPRHLSDNTLLLQDFVKMFLSVFQRGVHIERSLEVVSGFRRIPHELMT